MRLRMQAARRPALSIGSRIAPGRWTVSLTGNLATMALPDLLQLLAQGRRTGTLVVSRGGVDKSVFLREGSVISAMSTDPREYLGHYLVSHGVVDETQLAEAVRQHEAQGVPLGQVLVDLALISQEELVRRLGEKAEESLLEVFTWADGEFRFLTDELPDRPLIPISIGITGLVLDGLDRIDEWQEVCRVIPGSHWTPVAVGELLDEEGLDYRRRAILGAVDDDRTVEEIGLRCHCPDSVVRRTLLAQVRRGRLKVVRPRSAQTSVGPASASTRAVELLSDARELAALDDFEGALRRARAAQVLDPEDREVLTLLTVLERDLRGGLVRGGLDPRAVPALVADFVNLRQRSLSPQEGFVLSRVNATSDVASIVKISPMPEVDALLALSKLARSGLIELRPPDGKR